MPGRAFAEPRLAELYDVFDSDRSDLGLYVRIVDELGARSVLDVGCGTGSLATLLAAHGIDVIAVDPAAASVAVARRKPFADRVRWVRGEITDAEATDVDVVTMTGNVAQVFHTEEAWTALLRAAWRALRPGGSLVFETRDAQAEAWRAWTREQTFQRLDVDGAGPVQNWIELTAVRLPMVSFTTTFVFERDGTVATSASTLRFRDHDEVVASLTAAGFVATDVRDAPDRPGLELVFLARRPS